MGLLFLATDLFFIVFVTFDHFRTKIPLKFEIWKEKKKLMGWNPHISKMSKWLLGWNPPISKSKCEKRRERREERERERLKSPVVAEGRRPSQKVAVSRRERSPSLLVAVPAGRRRCRRPSQKVAVSRRERSPSLLVAVGGARRCYPRRRLVRRGSASTPPSISISTVCRGESGLPFPIHLNFIFW